MADWYVSSVNYNALPVWQASTPYTVGQIIRPTAPLAYRLYPQRCTVAGTSAATEPTWPTTIGGTVVSGGATFQNIHSQVAAWGWNAATGNLYTLAQAGGGGPVAGDRIFVANDHADSFSATYLQLAPAGAGTTLVISVNRAGNVPPTVADEVAGASITLTAANNILDCVSNMYWQGFTINCQGTAAVFLVYTGQKQNYFRNCAFILGASITRIDVDNPGRVVFDNTTVQFGATTQYIGATAGYPFDFLWINTPAAIQGGIIPAALFLKGAGSNGSNLFTCRGVDLSAVTGSLVNSATSGSYSKVLFDSCLIAPGVVRLGPTFSATPTDEAELINCFDGASILNERHTWAGDLTLNRSTVMVGGAQDDLGIYSMQMVSSSRSDRLGVPLSSFWLDVENTQLNTTRTATIEFISSLALNSGDISVLLEFQPTAGSSAAGFVNSAPSPLSTLVVLATSSAAWNNQPATPVRQNIALNFTPRQAGRLRAQVRLARPSTTVWVNPIIVVT
jgi:hypothetical protein